MGAIIAFNYVPFLKNSWKTHTFKQILQIFGAFLCEKPNMGGWGVDNKMGGRSYFQISVITIKWFGGEKFEKNAIWPPSVKQVSWDCFHIMSVFYSIFKDRIPRVGSPVRGLIYRVPLVGSRVPPLLESWVRSQFPLYQYAFGIILMYMFMTLWYL